MVTAIVGLGNIGTIVAEHLVAARQNVVVVDRVRATAETFAARSDGYARAATLPSAFAEADAVILAVYFDAIKELFIQHREALSGKVLIDPSNPIAPDGNGGFKKTIPEDQSSGLLLSGLLPPKSQLVKAFGTLSAGSLKAAANRTPKPAVLFYASDDAKAGQVAESLIIASGFDPVRVGGLDKSIRIEVGGDLHEFGKLGRLVTAKEARTFL